MVGPQFVCFAFFSISHNKNPHVSYKGYKHQALNIMGGFEMIERTWNEFNAGKVLVVISTGKSDYWSVLQMVTSYYCDIS